MLSLVPVPCEFIQGVHKMSNICFMELQVAQGSGAYSDG